MPVPYTFKDASGDTKTLQYPVPGVAGTPTSDVNSVQGIAGGVPVPTNNTMINGVSVSVGSGASNTGTSRVILATDQPEVPARLVATGLGVMSTLPSPSTNGTALGSPPANMRGARFYLTSNDAITFTIDTSQPSSAPSVTFTISAAGTGPNWDENLANGAMIYITSVSGTPKFRWY